MLSINSYLNEILKGFQAYLREGHKLCDLRSLHYDQGQVPDYRETHVQQYYLLRYAYGYAFEYKAMYNILLKQHPFQQRISVTSIGCGAELDYWALVPFDAVDHKNPIPMCLQHPKDIVARSEQIILLHQ